MKCHFCNAEITDTRLLATIFHFFARCCPACTKKYGELNEAGQLVYQAEAKHT